MCRFEPLIKCIMFIASCLLPLPGLAFPLFDKWARWHPVWAMRTSGTSRLAASIGQFEAVEHCGEDA